MIKSGRAFSTSPPEAGDVCDGCGGKPIMTLNHGKMFQGNFGCTIWCKLCAEQAIKLMAHRVLKGVN